MNHYDTLGVPKTANADQIKRAYRRRASKAHPDKGGDGAKMAELNKAWACLGDPQRRITYDETGVDRSDGPSPEQRGQAALMNMFNHVLDSGNIESNITVQVREALQAKLHAEARQKLEIEGVKRKLVKLRDKVRKKGDGSNVYHLLIDQRLQSIERAVVDLCQQIDDTKAALQLLDDYSEELTVETIQATHTIRFTTGTGTGW